MPQVKVETLKIGMIVSADVRNMDNMLLMPAGCAITEKHIDILNAWGITEIQVDASDEDVQPADILQRLPPEIIAKLTEDLQKLFWDPNQQGPVHQEIFQLMLRRKAMQLHGVN